jgi:phage-related protein
MSFYAQSFSYDDESSEFYNLRIANLGSGDFSNSGNGTVSFLEDFIFRKPKPYFYGVHYDSKLTFPMSIFSEDEITALDASYIQNWLFGQLTYKRLSIIQGDMDNFYFNCILTDPTIVRVGNVIRGFECIVVCDSQFVYNYPKTLTYDYVSSPSGSSIIFYNNSHYKGYLYPQMTFTTSSIGSSIYITNADDDDRIFSFTNLAPNETITIDNNLGIITSSTGLRRLSKFNKKFLRFVPGLNHLTLTGGISQLTLTYQFLRRVSG